MKLHIAISVIACLSAFAVADVVLTADGNDGHDTVWTKRVKQGKNSWGLKGTYSIINGSIWWNDFPCSSGTYDIILGAVIETDGAGPYRFFINDKKVAEGRYPYAYEGLECFERRLALAAIPLGIHYVPKGATISFWAESVYPCGLETGGEYRRFYEIRFVWAGGGEPPACPAVTKITVPRRGDELIEGDFFAAEGEGENLQWKCEILTDGTKEIAAGSGTSLDFTVPARKADPAFLRLILNGDNGSDTVTCPIVKTIIPLPLIRLDYPAGGEAFDIGEKILVRWTADTAVISDVDLKISPDFGRTWLKLNTGGSISLGSSQWDNYEWTVPATFQGHSLASSECLMRVEQYEPESPEHIDQSGIFSIQTRDLFVRGGVRPRHGTLCPNSFTHIVNIAGTAVGRGRGPAQSLPPGIYFSRSGAAVARAVVIGR